MNVRLRSAVLPTALFFVAACLPRADHADARADSSAGTPSLDSIPVTTSVLPTPADSSVPWSDLVATLRRDPDGVRAVMQTHARKVTMVMKDGRRFHATEPAMDAILVVLREVDPAGQILIATE